MINVTETNYLFPFNDLCKDEFDLLHNKKISPNNANNINIPSNCLNPKNTNYLNPNDIDCNEITKRSFSILTINARSLNKNFNKLETLLNLINFDPTVILVSETWISPNKPLLKTLSNYSFFNNSSNNKSGGAGIFIRNDVNFKIINNYNLNTVNCEEIWAEIVSPGGKSLIIGSLYRHPVPNFDEFQYNILKNIESLNNQNKEFIIGGDINIDLIKQNRTVNSYINELFSQGAIQLINSPTRIQNKTKTLIDHLYTNIHEQQFNTNCLIYDMSDHLPILTVLNPYQSQPPKYNRKLIRNMKKFNLDDFALDLQLNLSTFNFNNPNISGNELWNKFDYILNSTFNRHAPLRLQTRKEFKRKLSPWITNDVLKSIKHKNKLYKKAITQKWSNFKTYRNNLTRQISQLKSNYYKSEIDKTKNNPYQLWKTLNKITNLKASKNPITTYKIYNKSNQIVTDTKEISNIFNNYFANVGQELAKSINPNPSLHGSYHKHKSVRDSFFLNPISLNEMKQYIKNLNSKKSIPKHSIPIQIIKQCCEILAPVLTDIFNICITQGIFPNKLKYGEVRPIYKKGDKSQVNNFRPVCILSPFSQILERHFHTQTINFMNKNNIIHQHQYGFRTNSSTEMTITQITEHIIDKLQDDQTTCAVFLDLRKAFDTVNHDVLLTKLYNYGIRGVTADLFKSYLTDRTQRTVINNSISDIINLNCGIPQGSILGPLFFIIYINDLIDITKLSVKLFADDACLSYSCSNISSLEQIVNNELQIVNEWRMRNKLSVNFEKSNFMVFTRKKDKFNIQLTMEGHKLEQVSETKYLGVILDCKLNWSSHINFIRNKISRASYIISKIRYYVDLPILKMIYFSLVHPHLSYCVTAWGGGHQLQHCNL